MSQARSRHEWDQTALMWATLANTARDPKKQSKPFSPADVHPHRTRKDYEPQPIEVSDLSILKVLLQDGKSRRN